MGKSFLDRFTTFLIDWDDLTPQQREQIVKDINATLPAESIRRFVEAFSPVATQLRKTGRPTGQKAETRARNLEIWTQYTELLVDHSEMDHDGIVTELADRFCTGTRNIEKIITECRRHGILDDEWRNSPALKKMYPHLFEK